MSDPNGRAAQAETFAALHVPGRPIVLPNAWDAASARVIELAGAAAIATSSAAISWSLGRPDGNGITRDEAMGVLSRIASTVQVPVTADIETGYGETDEDLAATIGAVLDAGAVGVNLEDSGGDPLWDIDYASHRIRVTRTAADAAGIPMFINARIDVYFKQVGEPGGRLAETLRRAAGYLAAGASGVFVPWVTDLDLIAQIARGIDGPLNILAGPVSPPIAQLAQAGVARVSTGSSLAASLMGTLRRTTTELLGAGTFIGLAGGIPDVDMNEMFAQP